VFVGEVKIKIKVKIRLRNCLQIAACRLKVAPVLCLMTWYAVEVDVADEIVGGPPNAFLGFYLKEAFYSQTHCVSKTTLLWLTIKMAWCSGSVVGLDNEVNLR